MQKKEFIRQLNELVPRPDPVTTEALYRFDRECAESEYMDMLTALRVVARNFGGETLQGAYELSGASTITRTTGSVPDWRSRIRPSFPRAAVTLDTSACTSPSSWAAFLSFTRTFFSTWG